MFYSSSTNGFYSPDLHKNIPNDAVEITTEYWQSLLEGQGQGQRIWHDESGYPILTDHPQPTLTYNQQRSNEYPNIGEQLDMLWHAIDRGTLDKTSSFYTTIAEIKSKYPKG